MSCNSQVELEMSLDFYLQQCFSNIASDAIQPESPPYSIQNVGILNHPPSQEDLIPFPSPPLKPNHLSHPISSGDSNLEYFLSPEAWTNSFNLVGFRSSDLVAENSLPVQTPSFNPGSSAVSHLHTRPSENTPKLDAVSAFSIKHPEASPLIGKRKRSTSCERVETSEGSSNGATLKVFECRLDPGCFETFSRVEHLARHERKHTKEKPFRCHCQKLFSRLDNWRQHKAAVHKHLHVENAQTEKHLVEVQKGLQKSNKLRQATIVAATSQVKEPKGKKVKATATNEHNRQPESKQASSPHFTISGPSMDSFQIELSPEQSTPYNLSLVGSVESAPQTSRTQDFSNTLTDSALYSTDTPSRHCDFIPHDISPDLSDFSRSPLPMPLNISRVIPFPSMNHSTFTHAPYPDIYTSSLFNPFPTYSYPDPLSHTSFQPTLQAFTNHPPMMTHASSGVTSLTYRTIPRVPSQLYHPHESFAYGTCNNFHSLYPESFPTYSNVSMKHYPSGS